MEALTSEWEVSNAKNGPDGAYPGQRRQFARTEGNALIAAAPAGGGDQGSDDLVSGT